jgi:hypothetical protein
MQHAVERDGQQSYPRRLNLKVGQRLSCYHVVTDKAGLMEIPHGLHNHLTLGLDHVNWPYLAVKHRVVLGELEAGAARMYVPYMY